MAIEAISATPAYSTMSTIQTQQTSSKAAENVTTDGDTLQNINSNIDTTTAAIEKTHEAADDGTQSSGNQGQTDAKAAQDKENEKIKKAIENMKQKMNNSVVKYGIHEATNRVTIKIVDKDTDKVIKELPPEKTLDMLAKVLEMAGIMMDEKR